MAAIEEGTFKGFDDAELFFQTWPVSAPKSIILGIHGLGEHSGSYKYLAQGLEKSPYQLIVSDLRGHGRSAGKRGVGSVDEYILDIRLFVNVVQKRYPNLPLFFLGHSMGGLILTKLLIRNGSMGALGGVLSSPLYGVTVKVSAIKEKSATFLNAIAPNLTLANEIPNENLTHDKAIVEEYENDHLRHNRITPKLYTNMVESFDYVFKNADKITLPILMQQSGDDKVVSQPKGEEFFNLLTTRDKEKIVYEGYYHEIYNETGRQKPFTDLIRWLDKHRA
jgi:alpha-beta hydrolase superfamily lysophospholipase